MCGFERATTDSNWYVISNHGKLLVVVYVDIIFVGDVYHITCQFVANMKVEFEISMLGGVSYFLGLQITKYSRNFYFIG